VQFCFQFHLKLVKLNYYNAALHYLQYGSIFLNGVVLRHIRNAFAHFGIYSTTSKTKGLVGF